MYNTDIPSRAELPSSGQLVRSTLIAISVAALLLVTAVLPGEYGIDPTGVGRYLGLTEMGEIKAQLSKEAEADRDVDRQTVPERRSSLGGGIVAALFVRSAAAHETGHSAGREPDFIETKQPEAPTQAKTGRADDMTITLKPNQGAEIKLEMKKGAKASYVWTVAGGAVNFDTHGDSSGGLAKSYEKGRSVKSDEGVLEAAFDGNHGWFWRNRSKNDVTITLRTNGDYAAIKRVL